MASSVKFALAGIAASTLVMCAFIWNGLTSRPPYEVSSAEIDQEIQQNKQDLSSINYAFEKLSRPGGDSASGEAKLAFENAAARFDNAYAPSARIKEVWAAIDKNPESAFDEVKRSLQSVGSDEESDAVELMNLMLSVRAHESDRHELALSELWRSQRDPRLNQQSEYLASTMHVYLSTMTDRQASISALLQVIDSNSDLRQKESLFKIVDGYMPSGRHWLPREESMHRNPAASGATGDGASEPIPE